MTNLIGKVALVTGAAAGGIGAATARGMAGDGARGVCGRIHADGGKGIGE